MNAPQPAARMPRRRSRTDRLPADEPTVGQAVLAHAAEPTGPANRLPSAMTSPAAAPAHEMSHAEPEPEHEPQGIAVAIEDDRPIKLEWYILKVQSNREDSIRDGLLRRVQMAGLERYFGDVIVPIETVTEFKGRQETGHQAKAVSGLPRRPHGDQRRHLVPGSRDAGHRRFHRLGRPPVADGCRRMSPRFSPSQEEKTDEAPKLNIRVKKGDRVKINEGTFENFEGEVDNINEASGRVSVMINIFGRPTPVELEHWQIEPL